MSSRYYASKNQPWIPDQWFVAKHAYRGGDVPLAYMVPDGDDSQAKKRKSNARDWAKPGRGRYYNANTGQWEDVDDSEEPEFMTIEPASQTGFRIASVAKRSGRESNRELFRVVDPRGFELEIDPGNFLKIMRNANVDKGTIHTELAWVRAGSNNLLIPTKSDDYEEAVEESKARNSNLGMGDVELGRTV